MKTNKSTGSSLKDTTSELPFDGFSNLSWPAIVVKQSGAGMVTDPITQEEFLLKGTRALVYLPTDGSGLGVDFVKDPGGESYRTYLAGPLMSWWRTGRLTNPLTNQEFNLDTQVLIGYQSGKAHPIKLKNLMAGTKPRVVHREDLSDLIRQNGRVNSPGIALDNLIISGANLKGAHIPNSDFLFARLINVNLKEANIKNGSFESVNATQSSFDFANLEYVNFSFTVFKEVSFRHAKLKAAKFAYAELSKTLFRNADMPFVQFNFSTLTDVDFSYSSIEKANFYHAKARNTDFRGTILQGASFEGADLLGARFQGANIQGADFKNAKMDCRMQSLVNKGRINGGIVPME